MILSRIKIENFRNFSELDVRLSGNVVIVGENRVGKSNLVYALRLILDPTLPDSARQLSLSDFWDGLGEPDENDKISVFVEINDFEEDMDVLADLTDYRLDNDPDTVRLTYEFRPKAELDGEVPTSEDDYDFICFGGESEDKRFSHDLRRRLSMELLPALRDAEGKLNSWRGSPLRPLIENAFSNVDRTELNDIQEAIEAATERLEEFDTVENLADSIGDLFKKMSGPKQDIKPRLGFVPTNITRLYQNIRLLIDDGQRTINDASLGSSNIIFLTLKMLEINRLIEENRRDHTVLAIEEPEAHLHPHLQRSVYRHLFEDIGDQDEDLPLSILLTTHSPHIVSVAPLRSLVLLKETPEDGSIGCSTASFALSDEEEEDLSRYLDVTRAEMMFARGIILVEGDAERFLLPVFAESIGHSLDHLGITVCSVAGTNFQPYVKFLTALGIPFTVITDWDPRDGKQALGFNRIKSLAETIEHIRTGEIPEDLINELKAIRNGQELANRCEEYGIFTNDSTLEIELIEDDDFMEYIIATLREEDFGDKRKTYIDEIEADIENLDVKKYLSLIEAIGKGRFAQRLASRIESIDPPDYITNAIEFVVNNV